MNNLSGVNTAPKVKGIIGGLILMTVFTFFWFGVAWYGVLNDPLRFLLLIFPVLCVLFIYHIIKLRAVVKATPPVTKTERTDLEKKKNRLFIMAMLGEGFGIFIAINVVATLHHPELTMPAVALVVGLHCFPLASVFDRKMDYYIGAWSILIAIVAIVLSVNNIFDHASTLLFTGAGLALATSIYGVNMVINSNKTINL